MPGSRPRRASSRCRRPSGVRDQVIVVDNGSTDATPRRLGRYPVDRGGDQQREPGLRRGMQRRRRRRPSRRTRLPEQRHRPLGPLARSADRPLRRGRHGGSDRTPVQLRLGTAGGRRGVVSPGRHPRHASIRPRLGAGAPGAGVGDASAWSGSAWPCGATSSRRWAGFDTAYGIGRVRGRRPVPTHRGIGSAPAHRPRVVRPPRRVTRPSTPTASTGSPSRRRTGIVSSPASDWVVSSHDVAKVSACLITKDEEANIATCLASLEGFADEIVVYDTGSTDATVADRPGARRHRHRGLLGRRLLPGPQRRPRALLGGMDRLAGRGRDARLRRHRRTPPAPRSR